MVGCYGAGSGIKEAFNESLVGRGLVRTKVCVLAYTIHYQCQMRARNEKGSDARNILASCSTRLCFDRSLSKRDEYVIAQHTKQRNRIGSYPRSIASFLHSFTTALHVSRQNVGDKFQVFSSFSTRNGIEMFFPSLGRMPWFAIASNYDK